MEQLTLQQLFGVNVFEDSQILRINKSDLPGLTPLLNNTAESLLTAILLKGLDNFQGIIITEDNEAITDEFQNPLVYDNRDSFESLSIFLFNFFFSPRTTGICQTHNLVIYAYAPN